LKAKAPGGSAQFGVPQHFQSIFDSEIMLDVLGRNTSHLFLRKIDLLHKRPSPLLPPDAAEVAAHMALMCLQGFSFFWRDRLLRWTFLCWLLRWNFHCKVSAGARFPNLPRHPCPRTLPVPMSCRPSQGRVALFYCHAAWISG